MTWSCINIRRTILEICSRTDKLRDLRPASPLPHRGTTAQILAHHLLWRDLFLLLSGIPLFARIAAALLLSSDVFQMGHWDSAGAPPTEAALHEPSLNVSDCLTVGINKSQY